MTLFDVVPGDNADDSADQSGAAPSGPLRRVRATVAYDGSSFFGFAAQPGLRTVAGVLGGAIERALRVPVTITGAGRTDRGVHAWGQVISFDAPSVGLDVRRLQRSVNRMLAPAVVMREIAETSDDFDARFSAVSRRYRYTVLNRPLPDPFLASTSWHVAEPLDVAALRLASDPLLGEHDFSSFCRRPKGGRDDGVSLVRRVTDTSWLVLDDGILRFEIEASAFCHQMVRSIVGTLVEMGRAGNRRAGGRGPRAGEMLAIVRACDRAAAGPVAPPHGLCLWQVGYRASEANRASGGGAAPGENQ